ncbi:MAG: glutaredoxin family protein [Minicystis sp.]
MAALPLRILGSVVVAALALTHADGGHAAGRTSTQIRGVSSAASSITLYGASWCGACRSLEAKLTQRNIPFDKVDVDRNRDAYDRARAQSGLGNGIPLTHIARDTSKWVQGDDADAVERAWKGE